MSSNTSPSRPASPVRDGQPSASASRAYRDQLSPIITVTTPREKKKKQVGWVGNPEDRSPPNEVDYFSQVPIPDSRNSTPGVPDAAAITSPARRDSFDKEEITNALERILKPEDHAGPQMPKMPLPNLRLPKPVLRKQHYPENPSEPVEGLSHPSEIEARHRAGRLAESVSGVVSRASPDDSPITGNFDEASLLNRTGSHDHAAATGAVKPDEDVDQSGLKFRQRVEAESDRLVRSHTKRRAIRGAPMAFTQTQDAESIRSGTATPVAYDLDFVPPAPTNYHGGILGTLLKLYNSEDRNHSGEGSATTTPSRTPNRTPRGSPPSTAPGTPRPERPRSGLFGLGARHSASTLAELIGSSSTLAAPATSNKDWSDLVTDKLKRERTEREQRPKKEHKRKPSKTPQQKIEQLQIKKHIAEIISRHKYMVKLCRALMEFGAPTHRLEAYMAMSARVLAIEGQFLYLPGCMIISFDDTHTHTTEVKIVRVPQGVDLGKLRDVHEIYKLVVHDLIGVDDAMSRLDAVVTRKHKFNKWIRVVTYGLAAVCVAPFAFQGRWIDMPIAFVMGCIVGLMQLIMAPSSELYANVFETSAALLMSFLGMFCLRAVLYLSVECLLTRHRKDVWINPIQGRKPLLLLGSLASLYSTHPPRIHGPLRKSRASEPQHDCRLRSHGVCYDLYTIPRLRHNYRSGPLRSDGQKRDEFNHMFQPPQQLLGPTIRTALHPLPMCHQPGKIPAASRYAQYFVRGICRQQLYKQGFGLVYYFQHPRSPDYRCSGQPIFSAKPPRGKLMAQTEDAQGEPRPRERYREDKRGPRDNSLARGLRSRGSGDAARHLRAGAKWFGVRRLPCVGRDERERNHGKQDSGSVDWRV